MGGLKLPSPYLSGIKIERELVKKAQAIKEKREKCEKYIKDIERGIATIKNYKSTKNYEEKLKNAKSSFEVKDFDKALSLLEPLYKDIQEEIKKIFEDESKKIEKILLSVNIEDSARLKAYLEEAKSKVEQDPISSLNIIQDINKKISQSLKNVVEKKKRELISKVIGIEGFEWVKKDVEKVKGNSQQMLAQLEKIENKIKSSAKKIVDENINKADKLINLAKSAHYTLSVDLEKRDGAVKALNSGDYSSAIELSKEFLNSTKDSFKLFFKKLLDISGILIKEGEEMGENMKKSWDMLEQAKNAYNKDNLDEAINLIKKATEEAEKVKLHKVLELMKNARDKLLEAKKNGIDISPYLGMVDSAKNFLKIGKHKKAYDTILNALQMLERKINLYSQLKVEIEDLHKVNEELKKEDIILEGIEEKIENVKETVEKNPEEAEKMVDELKKLIKINLRDIASTLFQDISSILNKGKNLGFDLRGIDVEMENVEKLMKDENYKDSIIILRNIEEKLYEKIYKNISSEIEEFRKYGYEDVNIKINEINGFIEKGEIENAINSFSELRDLIFNREREKYENQIKEIENSISFLQELGENTDKVEKILENAREYLDKRDLEHAKESIEKCNSLIESLSQNLAERAYESAKDAAQKASELKIDLEKNGIMDMLNNAAQSLKDKKYAEVIKYTADINNKIKELTEKIEKLQKMRENLQKRVDELKNKKYPIDELQKLLIEIDNSIKNNDFEDAENLLNEGYEKAKNIEIKGKINNIKRKIEELGRIMRDFNFKDDYLTITEDFFINYKERRYEKLEDTGKNTIEKLKKSIELIFNNYVNKLERLISDLNEIGIQVDSSPIAKSKEKFWEGNILEAFSILKDFESHIKNIHGEKMELMNIENRLGRIITVASSLGIDTKEYLERAKEIESNEELSARKNGLEKLSKEIESRIRDKIENIIKDVEGELDKLRKRGENTTTPEAMLMRAKSLMDKGDFKNTLALTLDVMEEIENLGMQKNTAYGILKTLNEKINKMKGLLPKDLITEYKNAKSLFLNERYKEAIDKAMNVSEKLWNIEKTIEIIKDKNKELKRYIEQGKALGIDMKSVLIPLAKAKKELQSLHYDAALKLVNEAHKEARKKIEEIIDGYRRRYEEIIKSVIEFDLRDELEDEIKGINDAFANKDAVALESLIPKLKDKALSIVANIIKEKLDEFEKMSKLIEGREIKGKIDLNKEREKLEKLKDKPKEFLEYYRNLKERMIGIIKDSIKSDIEKFVDKLNNFEDLGLNLGDYKERASKLMEEIDEMDYNTAINELEEIKKNFETYIKEYTKDKAARAKDMVMKYNKKKAEEYEKKILKRIESGNYKEAIKIYEEAIKYVGEYRNVVAEFNKKAMELKELIKSAISLGLNMDPYIKRLKEALSSQEDLSKGIEAMENIENEIWEEIEKLKPKLTVAIDSTQKANDKYFAKIRVRNNGNSDARNVRLSLDGSLKSENDITIMKIAKDSEEIVESFLVEGEGDKIKGKISYERFDGKRYEEEFEIEYKISKRGFHIEKNKEKVKCTLCRGTILPGMDIAVCDTCGAVYHVPCAKRAGKCLKCGTPFNFE